MWTHQYVRVNCSKTSSINIETVSFWGRGSAGQSSSAFNSENVSIQTKQSVLKSEDRSPSLALRDDQGGSKTYFWLCSTRSKPNVQSQDAANPKQPIVQSMENTVVRLNRSARSTRHSNLGLSMSYSSWIVKCGTAAEGVFYWSTRLTLNNYMGFKIKSPTTTFNSKRVWNQWTPEAERGGGGEDQTGPTSIFAGQTRGAKGGVVMQIRW